MIKKWQDFWDNALLKIGGDKHFHFEESLIGAVYLRRKGVSMKLTFIIVFGIGFLKECFDWKIGREKKFDWVDLLADFCGTMVGLGLTVGLP